MNTGKNEKIELSRNQQNPGLAKPEDFNVVESDDPAYLGRLPFHGQCGDTPREYHRLLTEREKNRPNDVSPYDSRPVIPNGPDNTAGVKPDKRSNKS